MAVGGTPVGPVLAGPILARASYIKVYILGKFILLRRKFCPKVFVTIYYTIWYGKYGWKRRRKNYHSQRQLSKFLKSLKIQRDDCLPEL